MKSTKAIITTVLGVAMSSAALVGCGTGEPAASVDGVTSTVADDTSSTAGVTQTQEELVTEYKEALAAAPEHKTMTIASHDETTYVADDDTKEEKVISASSTYKFDESGDKAKVSVEMGDATAGDETMEINLKLVSDGDKAVCVTDGEAYAGTADQFGTVAFKGIKAFLDHTMGDLSTIADIATSIEKSESNGLTFYTLELDATKYVEGDETLSLLAESGLTVNKAQFVVGFDEDGNLASVDMLLGYEKFTVTKALVFSDFDATTVEALPEATKTYDDMESDIIGKLSDLTNDIADEAQEGSEAEAATK